MARSWSWISLALMAGAGCTAGGVWLDAAPGAAELRIEPAHPVTGSLLRAVVAKPSVDPEGAPVTYAFRWMKNGEPQADLLDREVPADRVARGDRWEVTATPSDGGQQGASARAEVEIANAPPTLSFTLDPAAPTRSTGARVLLDAHDADGDELTTEIVWSASGEAPVQGDSIPAERLRKGSAWTVRVQVRDPFEAAEPTVRSFIVANAPPAIEVALEPSVVTAAAPLRALVRNVDPDGDPLAYSFRWRVDARETPLNGDSVPRAELRRGQTWTVSVVASDGSATSSAVEASALVRNAAPSVLAAAVTPAEAGREPARGCEVVGYSDPDGDAESVRIEWLVNDVPVVSGPQLPANTLRRGDVVACRVTPTDGIDFGASVSSPRVVVENTAPVLAGVELVPAMPRRDQPLQAVALGAFDADGDAIALRFEWWRNGVQLEDVTAPVLDPNRWVAGDRLRVVAIPDDGFVKGAPVQATGVAVNTPPRVAAVALTPALLSRASSITAVASGVEDADGDPVTLDWSWSVAGVPVQTAGPLLPVSAFRRGDAITVQVTPRDRSDAGAPVSAAGVIVNAPPSVGAVIVSPNAGDTTTEFRCSASGWADPDGDASRDTLQWRADGQLLGEGPVLAAGRARRGQKLTCTITPSDGVSPGTPVTSSAITLANAKPILSSLALTASPTRAAPIVATSGTLTDADGDAVAIEWSWRLDGAEVRGQTTASLPPERFTKGSTVTVRATPVDGHGSGDALERSVLVLDAPPSFAAAQITPTTGDRTTPFDCATFGWADADGDPERYAFEWRANGTLVGTERSLPAGTVAKGAQLTCSARPDDGTLTGPARTSASVTIENAPPSLTGARLAPTRLNRTDTATASGLGFSDPDGDAADFHYRWFVNDVLVTGASAATLTGAFVRGDLLSAEVAPFDGTAAGPAARTPTLVVGNAPPSVASVAVAGVGGAVVRKGGAIVATASQPTDPDFDPVGVRYAWSVARGGVAIPIGGDSMVLSDPTLVRGEAVTVRVTPNDGLVDGVAATGSLTIANTAPSAPTAALYPAQPQAGVALACFVSANATDGDGDALSYRIEWTLNGASYAGPATATATSSTLAAASVRFGDSWGCRIVADDGTDTTPSAALAATVGPQGLACAWSSVASYALTAAPAGVVTKNGALNSQSYQSVGGRTALRQDSDWNHYYLPASFDPAYATYAVEADVWMPSSTSSRSLGLSLMSENAGYNDVIRGLSAGLSCASSTASIVFSAGQYASTSTNSICCSTGAPSATTVPPTTTALKCADYAGRWVRVRFETSKSASRARFLLEGIELANWTTTYDNTGTRLMLASGAPSWTAAGVAYSGVQVFRGTPCP